MKVGIEGLSFDSAHYTKGVTAKCSNLHGHTYTVNVEVEGEVSEEVGMVMDFGEIKELVEKVLEKWDHKFLVSQDEADRIETEGPFNLELKIMAGEPTTENIAAEIAREIFDELKLPVEVKLYEGKKNYVMSECSGK